MAGKSYRILFTNNSLGVRGGSELFVRDLAIALQRRGHHPVAYSTALGRVADELRQNAVPVIDDLGSLALLPDVIHGHHHLDVAAAALAFPKTPIVFVCHGWVPWEEMPLSLPTIKRYVAVSDLTRERLLTARGVSSDAVTMIPNFVDTERFASVRKAPNRLKKALLFGNGWISIHPHAVAIKAACLAAGIDVDMAGHHCGRSLERPEETLLSYDLVFAVGRAALEAMAVGCAVIVADTYGLGGLVTSSNFDELRSANFAYARTKGRPFTEATVAAELASFNRIDASAVTQRTRAEASLAGAVASWEVQYRAALTAPAAHLEEVLRESSAYLRTLKATIWNILQAGEEKARIMEENRSLAQECLMLAEQNKKLRFALASLQACSEREIENPNCDPPAGFQSRSPRGLARMGAHLRGIVALLRQRPK